MTSPASVALPPPPAIEPPTAGAKAPRLRLAYLDGIRGLAALYVVLGHIYIALTFLVPDVQLLPALEQAMDQARVNPRLAAIVAMFVSHCLFMPVVQVFIVLSGYCLMLPVVQANGAMRGGFGTFVRRRATRILPPYFAMLVIALAISALMDAKALVSPPLDDFTWGKVVSHIFLVHNWSKGWNKAIDPPMWSIAVEWQIYFLFPLLLLPVWRRAGIGAAIALGFLVGVAPHFLFHGHMDWSYPWFLGLFALGMAAADLNLSRQPLLQAWHERLPWGYISLALWACVLGMGLLKNGWASHHAYFADVVVGLATTTLLVSCTRASLSERSAREHPGLRVLGAPMVTALGAFSYSIYLTHYPLMMLFFYATIALPMSVLARTGLMFGVFLPLSLAFAYGFYVVFERPFILHAPKRRPAADPSASAPITDYGRSQ
jgi:peptidoglycan/LPS O-acetylase OafA/YrhL